MACIVGACHFLLFDHVNEQIRERKDCDIFWENITLFRIQ